MNNADLVRIATGEARGFRRVRTYFEIVGHDYIELPAKPSGLVLPDQDFEFFTDGSLRHVGGKVNGRDARRARAKTKRGRR